MAWYDVTYSCGHSESIQLYGKHTDRESRIKYLEGTLCPACYLKKIQEETEKTTKEFEMPELTGTPKQIQWAKTIRADTITSLSEKRNYYVNEGGFSRFDEVMAYLISNYKDAHWWIDSRTVSNNEILSVVTESMNRAPKNEAMKEAEAEALAEATVYPEDQIIASPASIEIKADTVCVFFEKNDALIDLVKKTGYRWNGSKWYREINKMNGPAEDRAAEIGNKLLVAGAPIRIINNEAREKAVSGTYEKEHTRWIMQAEGSKLLAVKHELSDYLYNQAKQITGARYDKEIHAVVINPMYYEEIELFAKTHGFRFTENAQAEIDKQKHAREKAKTVKTIASEEEAVGKEGEILDDLLDEK